MTGCGLYFCSFCITPSAMDGFPGVPSSLALPRASTGRSRYSNSHHRAKFEALKFTSLMFAGHTDESGTYRMSLSSISSNVSLAIFALVCSFSRDTQMPRRSISVKALDAGTMIRPMS